jgi:hypothetical protein
MIKEILCRIGKRAVVWGLNKLYDYVDKDENGNISWVEISEFIDEARSKLTKIKRKI